MSSIWAFLARVVHSMRLSFENNQTTKPLLYFSIIHVQPNRHTMPSDVAGQALKVRRWLVLLRLQCQASWRRSPQLPLPRPQRQRDHHRGPGTGPRRRRTIVRRHQSRQAAAPRRRRGREDDKGEGARRRGRWRRRCGRCRGAGASQKESAILALQRGETTYKNRSRRMVFNWPQKHDVQRFRAPSRDPGDNSSRLLSGRSVKAEVGGRPEVVDHADAGRCPTIVRGVSILSRD